MNARIMAVSIEVDARVAGAPPDNAQIGRVIVELEAQSLTAAELIARTVECQVRELLARRKLSTISAARLLHRQYLTDEEIDEQAAAGAVRTPKGLDAELAIDTRTEIRKALRAFSKGQFFLTVNGRRIERTDEVLSIGPGSRVTFLRLIPLAGGSQ
jgi:hypothetical protein